jgi:hypothetical protein
VTPAPRPVIPARNVAPRPAIPAATTVRSTPAPTPTPARAPAPAPATATARTRVANTPARKAPARSKPPAKPRVHRARREAPRHRTLPILVPPSYATSQPLVRLKRLVPAAARDGGDETTLTAAAGALVVLALSCGSLLALTRRLEREVGRP